MTATHRAEALKAARANAAKAREAYRAADAKGDKKARAAAADELEFWTNKTAFLTHAS